MTQLAAVNSTRLPAAMLQYVCSLAHLIDTATEGMSQQHSAKAGASNKILPLGRV